MSQNIIIKIFFPLPFDNGFFYFVNKDQNPKIGDIFLVSFGKKTIYGIATEILKQNPENFDQSKIKNVIEKYPNFSLNKKLLDFFLWVANYNLIKLGAILKLSLSIFLKNSTKKSTTIIFKINKNYDFSSNSF